MGLVEKLYPEDDEYLKAIWNRFVFFDPNMYYLKCKNVARALAENRKNFLIDQFRASFFPTQDDETVNEEFRKAINRGIKTINNLCKTNLANVDYDFSLHEVKDLDLFEWVRLAREDWIRARNGKHTPLPEPLFAAYNNVRNIGIGYRTLMIDESPDVVSSLRAYNLVLKWFGDRLDFQLVKEDDFQQQRFVWTTSPGIEIFSTSNRAFHSRLKALDNEGNIRYDSILMKMFNDCRFPDDIYDYTGVEFVVRDELARNELIKYFGSMVMATGGKLERFKMKKNHQGNVNSSSEYGAAKFILRIPIHSGYIKGHPLGGLIHERTPVEVQILTLEEDEIRTKNPEVAHDTYKKKQFMRVFPAWFPRQIYRPFLKDIM
ncbi:hypothetical protein HYT56_00255 [Candidatus Woesearchaeota archaeon]|nr:hypothetical protein [Candidatus Woesearchaeota archaeon]